MVWGNSDGDQGVKRTGFGSREEWGVLDRTPEPYSEGHLLDVLVSGSSVKRGLVTVVRGRRDKGSATLSPSDLW